MHDPRGQPPGEDHNSAERIAPSRRSCLPDNLRLYQLSRLEHDRHHPKRQARKQRKSASWAETKRTIMHKPAPVQPKNVAAEPSGLLAPDTSGMNFYRAAQALTDLLRIHLPETLFRHIEPYLDRLGELAGGALDEYARLADRHTPVLH